MVLNRFGHMLFATLLIQISAYASADDKPLPLPKLYICNNDGTDVMIADVKTNKVVKPIDVGGQPHGATATAKGDRLYVSCSGPNDVIAFDTATDSILWREAVGPNPHMLAVTPDGKTIYVGIFGPSNNPADYVDVIDTATHKKTRSIKTGHGPHIVYARSNERVYVTAWHDHHVSVLDAKTGNVLKQIQVAGIVRPVVADETEKNLYVALSSFHGFVVADLDKGQLVNIVENPPYPLGTEVPEYNTPVHGLDIRPNTQELWVTSVIDDKIYIYNLPKCDLAGKVEVGNGPNWITFSPDGKLAYVSNAIASNVMAIDTVARKVTATIPAGKAPKRVVYVADRTAAPK